MSLRLLVHGIIGLAALVLAGFNLAGADDNRRAAAALEGKRPELARLQRVATVNNGLVQLIVKAAVERDDASLRALLAANGVTFKVNAGEVNAGKVAAAAAPAQAVTRPQP
jgi:hypothetical protein